MSSQNYTPKFLEVMAAVSRAAKESPGSESSVFEKGMKGLGWFERLQNLYRIRDKATGKFLLFRPNSSQLKFLKNKSGRDTILKSRQFGFTTLMCLYAYDRALWDGWATGIMSHQKERTAKIFEIIKNTNILFRKDWGKLYNPPQSSDNANSISWKESKASITVSFDFKSLTVHFLHISESGFISNDRLTDSIQSVPENGEIVEESTPNGPTGLFYTHYQQWKKMGSVAPFKGHFFPWFDHYPEFPERWIEKAQGIKLTQKEEELKEQYGIEDYHIAWRRWKILESCNTGEATSTDNAEEIFEKQYPSNDVDCFLCGDTNVYPGSVLKIQQAFVVEPTHRGFLQSEDRKIKLINDPKGLLSVWECPVPNKSYAIGADTASGSGGDASVAYVIDRATGSVVAELYGQIDPTTFADELYKLGKYYGYCHICVENNHHGSWVIAELIKKGYTRLYRRYVRDGITLKMKTEVGFNTSVSTKIPLTEQHVQACRDGAFRCKSARLFEEMSTFVQIASKNGRSFRREASGSSHDDCVMAACLAWEQCCRLGDVMKPDAPSTPIDLRSCSVDPYTGALIDSGPEFGESRDEFTGFRAV